MQHSMSGLGYPAKHHLNSIMSAMNPDSKFYPLENPAKKCLEINSGKVNRLNRHDRWVDQHRYPTVPK